MSSAPHTTVATGGDGVWRPARGSVGMLCLIAAESCIFLTFVVAYLFYIGQSATGPQPREVLELPMVIVNSIALISSSITVVASVRALEAGRMPQFKGWLLATIALGGWFVVGTGLEWSSLMASDHLYIGTNLFGTTFYSLVGLHLLHVIVGLALLGSVLVCGVRGKVGRSHAHAFDMISWYWHFVDAVWVIVFTTVYVVGR
ncbi:MAG: heme-copper oxidase subunit III [Phycisphaerales bacterium]|nr:heme-copper oxidase subunit III [Phycisphaerales bacterium]